MDNAYLYKWLYLYLPEIALLYYFLDNCKTIL